FLLCNEIPTLNDTNLATRFIHIAFPVSFRGREDVTIPNKLKAELPGIANRCLAAYRRLCERGRFIQPASGLEIGKQISRDTYPFKAFMEDWIVVDRDGEIRPIVMLCRLHEWCRQNGESDLLKRVTIPSHLSRKLKEYILRENIEGINLEPLRSGNDPRVWIGLRLKTKAELEGRPELKLVKTDVEPVVADVKPMIRVVSRRFLRRF